MRGALACAVAAAALAAAGVALAKAGFADRLGDHNAAPDVTAVSLADSADGATVTVTVAVANYPTLPANSWVNLWFDLDNNQETGDAGDEALIRYLAGGTVESYLWDGRELRERTSEGISASYQAGTLTVALPRAAVGGASSFGVLAVASRGQRLGDEELIASDYAPDDGRSAYVGPGPSSFPDAGHDEDAAPDIGGVRVADTRDGWLSFAVSLPNYATLPPEAVLLLLLDADANPRTGEDGIDRLLTVAEGAVELERWDERARRWRPDAAPTRARVRTAPNLVTVEVHASELESPRRLAFGLITADLDPAVGRPLAVDVAPDAAQLWRYALVHQSLRLLAGRPSASPARPLPGRPLTVSVPVRRSDTGGPLLAGSVTCRAAVDGRLVPAHGRLARGRAECALALPPGARVVQGTVTVRASGAAVTARFSYRVR